MNIHVARTPHFRTRFTHTCCQGQTGSLTVRPDTARWAKLGQENLLRIVRWLRWHCRPDTGFEIRALAVRGRARYLSVTEVPHNTDIHTWMGKKHFLFLLNRRDRKPRTLAWKTAVLTTTLGPPPHTPIKDCWVLYELLVWCYPSKHKTFFVWPTLYKMLYKCFVFAAMCQQCSVS